MKIKLLQTKFETAAATRPAHDLHPGKDRFGGGNTFEVQVTYNLTIGS
jgi:hypothetical protein